MKAPGTRSRRFAPKTRTGCLTCKRRRVKCDERKPFCFTCERIQVKCAGYAVPKAWVFEPQSCAKSPPTSPKYTQDDGIVVGAFIPVLEPVRFRTIFDNTGEAGVLMSAYLDLSRDSPMAWDTALFRAKSVPLAACDEFGSLVINDAPLDPTPLRRRSHLALATATLIRWEPKRYPIRLNLKYMQAMLSELRSQIASERFLVEDLLSAISQTLIACVVRGDASSSMAHLRAATELVKRQGGLDNISSHIAAGLRYADFHFSMNFILAPTFPMVVNLHEEYENDLVDVPKEIIDLGDQLLKQTRSLSIISELCVRRLIHSGFALAQIIGRGEHSAPTYKDVNWLAAHTAGTVQIMLATCPGAFNGDSAVPPTTNADRCSIVLLLWTQLLFCRINERLTHVCLKWNVLPVCDHEIVHDSDTWRDLPTPFVRGLARWNDLIAEACVDDGRTGNWRDLIPILADIEAQEVVQLEPFMRKVLALRYVNESQEVDVKPFFTE